MNSEELTHIERAEILISIGYELSQSFDGVIAPNRKMATCTMYLGRIIDMYGTLISLQYKSEKNNFIDYSSVAAISRNVIEACNTNFYLSTDYCSESETELRFLIADYHSLYSLIFVIDNMFNSEKDINQLKKDLEQKNKKLKSNLKFIDLDKQLRNLILKGKRSAVYTQFEICEKRGMDLSLFKSMYKIMSSQTHTSPYAIEQIRLLTHDNSYEEHNDFFAAFITDFVSYNIARTIIETGEIWGRNFARDDSKTFIYEMSTMFDRK